MAKSYLTNLPESAINTVFSERDQLLKAAEAKLFKADGSTLLDLTAPHQGQLLGHNIDSIHEKLTEQLATSTFQAQLSQHHPLVKNLREILVQQLPSPDTWQLAFANSEEMALENALEKVFNYWHKKNQSQRRIVLTFAHSAHGEHLCCKNFNASYLTHNPFQDFLVPTEHLPYPSTWQEDDQIEKKEKLALARLKEFLCEQSMGCAALLIEPLLQVKSGMLACRPIFLDHVCHIMKQHQIPIIFDERNLSPMRSGRFFVSDYLKHVPDIILLGHCLTNNIFPLGTILTQKEFACSQPPLKVYHLACVAAVHTLKTLVPEQYTQHTQALQATHALRLNQLNRQPIIKNIRFLGALGAFEVICEDISQQDKLLQWFHQACFEKNLMIQPHGKQMTILPPLCMTVAELNQVYDIIECVMNTLPLKYITSDLIDQ